MKRPREPGARRRGPSGAAPVIASVLLIALTLPVSAQTSSDPAPATPSATDTQHPALLPEPSLLTRAIRFVDRRTRGDDALPKNGVYVDFGGMPTGAGWISLGPGYRHRLFGDRALIDASTSVSWRAYKAAQARFEVGDIRGRQLVVGSQVLWHDLTQVHYWGNGPDSLEQNSSEYRLKTIDVIGYLRVRPKDWLTIGGAAGWLHRPRLSSSVGPFDRDYPYTREVFPADPVFGMAEQPNFLHGDVSLTVDTRTHRGYPTSGGLFRAAAASYSDRDSGLFTFRRYQAEALQLVPVIRDVWVIGLHGWAVASDVAPGRAVPFYMAPSLGGGNSIRGFNNYRFHDRNLLVVNAESRWALFRHLDGAVFIDKGSVAARFADLNLDTTTYGVGFRVHTDTTTLVRFDIAHSREGWNFLLKMHDPFRFGRLSRHTAAVPFAP